MGPGGIVCQVAHRAHACKQSWPDETMMASQEEKPSAMKRFWEERSTEKQQTLPGISRVLDPGDKVGFKNRYLDVFSKYYVLKHLKRSNGSVVLEIGCGTGRLTEYIADHFAKVIGCDLSDNFIAECNASAVKKPNTVYLRAADHDAIRLHKPEVALICWVVQHLEQDEDVSALFRTLREYGVKRFVLLEHNRIVDHIEEVKGAFYTKVRSISTYQNCLLRAGCTIDEVCPLGEVNAGSLYRLSMSIYGRLPKRAHVLAPLAFHIDRLLIDGPRRDRNTLISSKYTTDMLISGRLD